MSIRLRGFGLTLYVDNNPAVKMTRRVDLVGYVCLKIAYARQLTTIRPLLTVRRGKTFYFAQTVRPVNCQLADVHYVTAGMYAQFNTEVRDIVLCEIF